MQVEVDDRSGFCFGVVNAISKAEEQIGAGKRLVSLGDIVHNGAEVVRLEALGLETVPEDTPMESLAGRTVLIRAHGEPPATYDAALLWGVTLVDATCPVVAKLQRTVAEAHVRMQRVGGQVVIFGKRGHAEVRGLAGQIYSRENHAPASLHSIPKSSRTSLYAAASESSQALPMRIFDENRGEVIVIENESDLDRLDFTRPIYFLAQTTNSLSEFERLGREIVRRSANPHGVTVHDTVCRQVSGREGHLAEFARRFDAVMFVAGAKSSNGRVLFEAVRAANPRSYKIECVGELRPEWFSGVGSVGVCGATSTPKWLMEEVAAAIRNMPDR